MSFTSPSSLANSPALTTDLRPRRPLCMVHHRPAHNHRSCLPTRLTLALACKVLPMDNSVLLAAFLQAHHLTWLLLCNSSSNSKELPPQLLNNSSPRTDLLKPLNPHARRPSKMGPARPLKAPSRLCQLKPLLQRPSQLLLVASKLPLKRSRPDPSKNRVQSRQLKLSRRHGPLWLLDRPKVAKLDP